MSTEKWLVVVGEETLEVSLDDLRALILEGRVKLTDRVKKGGLNWIEARHPPDLRGAFADRHAALSEVRPSAALRVISCATNRAQPTPSSASLGFSRPPEVSAHQL